MGSFSDTPALLAKGTIAPFTFVKADSSNDDCGLQASANTDTIFGVSDGSTNGPTSANHAVTGEPITLQGGDVVLIKCNSSPGTINPGTMLEAASDGTCKAATVTAGPARRFHGYAALQAGAAGLVIRARLVGGFIYYPTTL